MNVDGLRSGGWGAGDGEGLGLVAVLIPRLPEGLGGGICQGGHHGLSAGCSDLTLPHQVTQALHRTCDLD